MKSDYIIERQGKKMVLYAGLLDEAHRQGLTSIQVTLIQHPAENNDYTAICHARVTMERDGQARHFEDIGDANAQNVGKMIAAHIIRMAATRSKARALRDAVNVSEVAAEEMGDIDEEVALPGGRAVNRQTGEVREARPAAKAPESTAAPPAASASRAATANQLSAIRKLLRITGQPDDLDESMTAAQASDKITELSRLYDQKKNERMTAGQAR